MIHTILNTRDPEQNKAIIDRLAAEKIEVLDYAQGRFIGRNDHAVVYNEDDHDISVWEGDAEYFTEKNGFNVLTLEDFITKMKELKVRTLQVSEDYTAIITPDALYVGCQEFDYAVLDRIQDIRRELSVQEQPQ